MATPSTTCSHRSEPQKPWKNTNIAIKHRRIPTTVRQPNPWDWTYIIIWAKVHNAKRGKNQSFTNPNCSTPWNDNYGPLQQTTGPVLSYGQTDVPLPTWSAPLWAHFYCIMKTQIPKRHTTKTVQTNQNQTDAQQTYHSHISSQHITPT